MKTVERLCPHCKKPAGWDGNKFRPFCSERCKLIDLGAWATEQYRVPIDPSQELSPEELDALNSFREEKES